MVKTNTLNEANLIVRVIPVGTEVAARAVEEECYKIIANSKKWKDEIDKTRQEVAASRG